MARARAAIDLSTVPSPSTFASLRSPDGRHRRRVQRAGRAAADRHEIRVRDIFIAGLGDSIASGEGNPDRPIALAV